MKSRMILYMLLMCSTLFACDNLSSGSSSLSGIYAVPEGEITHVSYDKIENRTYVHVELPDTLREAHTVIVCAYDPDHENTCCFQWLFEDVSEFWIPYSSVENCVIRVTCWGRFGVRYITGIW